MRFRRVADSPIVRSAFSLTELVIVMVVIAVLAALAIPRLSRAAALNDVRAAHQTFLNLERAVELYYVDTRDWPNNQPAGKQPPELDPYLMGRPMEQPAPIGGAWDWNGEGSVALTYGYNLGIYTPTAKIRNRFETLADDGNPTTGQYRIDGYSVVRPVSPP